MTASNHPNVALRLSVPDDRFAVCKLEPDNEVPDWAVKNGFFSATRTPDELSIVCLEQNVPEGLQCERGWRAFKVQVPLAFSETGVLVSLAAPLAEEGISLFAVSTYDTDYVLVKEGALEPATTALRSAGHEVHIAASTEEPPAIRPATGEDEPFLWEMLAEAAQEPTVRAVVENSGTARYVEGWGHEGDLGFIAVSRDGHLVGAAWLRLLTNENGGYGYLDDKTPELAIAVHPDFRGMGVGARLLARLFERAREIYSAVCLSVRADNPAFHLYEKMGFEVVPGSEKTNRANGFSLKMRRNLRQTKPTEKELS